MTQRSWHKNEARGHRIWMTSSQDPTGDIRRYLGGHRRVSLAALPCWCTTIYTRGEVYEDRPALSVAPFARSDVIVNHALGVAISRTVGGGIEPAGRCGVPWAPQVLPVPHRGRLSCARPALTMGMLSSGESVCEAPQRHLNSSAGADLHVVES